MYTLLLQITATGILLTFFEGVKAFIKEEGVYIIENCNNVSFWGTEIAKGWELIINHVKPEGIEVPV